MIEKIPIRVYEVVGSSLCVASGDGQKVHDQIAEVLKANKQAELSFANVRSLTSAFLNSAVGQLYGEFTDEQIRDNLSASGISPEDLALLKRVVDTAKQYFKDPKRFSATVQKVLKERDAK